MQLSKLRLVGALVIVTAVVVSVGTGAAQSSRTAASVAGLSFPGISSP